MNSSISSRRSEKRLGNQAKRNYLDMQPGDVPLTFASADLLERLTGYRPHTSLDEGIAALVNWYRDYRRSHGDLAIPSREPISWLRGNCARRFRQRPG